MAPIAHSRGVTTMAKKVCMITGGNSGIGRAAATRLASQGAEVIVACRNLDRGEEAVSRIRHDGGSSAVSLLVMDLSSKHSIESACDAFKLHHNTLDCLIHNAADFDVSRRAPQYSDDGIETVWATNHIGPVLLTRQLGSELVRSEQGRVITVASQGLMVHPFLKVRLDDPEFREGPFSVEKAYYQSKLAQVMYTYWLAERYRGTPMTANCIRVANVRIDVNRYPNLSPLAKRLYAVKSRFALTPEQMAEVYAWLALSPECLGQSGGYFDEKRRRVSSSRYSRDPANILRVIELTERYVPGLLAGSA
jgi:NAD(P)-dependent dehydrogenase (short-subunit alcohol dehydrogenase family)